VPAGLDLRAHSLDARLAAIGQGEIHLLTQIALVGMVWQRDIAKALARQES